MFSNTFTFGLTDGYQNNINASLMVQYPKLNFGSYKIGYNLLNWFPFKTGLLGLSELKFDLAPISQSGYLLITYKFYFKLSIFPTDSHSQQFVVVSTFIPNFASTYLEGKHSLSAMFNLSA